VKRTVSLFRRLATVGANISTLDDNHVIIPEEAADLIWRPSACFLAPVFAISDG
jgi:hypothetical protein